MYCPGDAVSFPSELVTGDVVMGVWPRQLKSGERAAIRFANLRETTQVFTARFEVFGDGAAEPGRDYQLLSSTGTLLVAEPNGSYEIVVVAGSPPSSGDPPATSGESPPPAWLESLVDNKSLFLYVRPLELLLNDDSELSIRDVAQPVELIATSTATATLAMLRVSVPAGHVQQLPAGSDTIIVDVRVDVLDAMGLLIAVTDLPIAETGLLLVAELLSGSARSWLPSVSSPAALSATGETGVFEGRLTVALDEDDTAAELSIGVIGFTEGEGIIVAPAVVRVLQPLSFVAVAAATTEGADGVELQIGVPQGHVGMPVEIDLNLAGTALLGTDYTLVSLETPGSVSIDETASGVTLRLAAVPDTQLMLLLRPRANDAIRQGDRRAELQLSGYRVAGEEREAEALPTALGVTILDPYLPVMQRLLGVASGAACVLLDEDNDDLVQLRCWSVAAAAVELYTVLDADDILSARQLAFGERHVCWLQQDRQVACAGSDSSGQATIPDLGATPTVAVVAGREGSCAVDQNGAVRCWGRNGDEQSALPADLGSVTQLSLGDGHGCALHADGVVRCWGEDGDGQATPPEDLGPVLQLALGYEHSCALQRDGQLRCWGANSANESMPPVDLGLATQLASGANHSCALLEAGEVRCWGANDLDQLIIPSLPPSGVKSLVAGGNSSCALLAEGSVRCWGSGLENAVPAELQPGDVAVSVLPQRLLVGQRAAIRFADLRETTQAFTVRIELLDDTAQLGSDYRLLDAAGQPVIESPDGRYRLAGNTQPAAYIEALPDTQGLPLRTLYVLPLETVPADGAAPSLRRAAQRVELTDATATLARLRVSLPAGNVLQLPAGTDTITVDVRVAALDTTGLPITASGLLLVAERIAGSARYWLPSVASPAALSATGETGVFEGRLMVALDEDDTAVELRIGVIGFAPAQGIIVQDRLVQVLQSLSFIAAASMTTEGADGVELQIRVPQEHVGSRVEIELTVVGTALAGLDYTLDATGPAQGIILGDGSNSTIKLSVDPAPAEPLRLLLRPRGDDRISQGLRLLNLRISGYRVVPESAETVNLPPALNLTIADDELPTVRQVQFFALGGVSACTLLSDGSVRCVGDNQDGRATPPKDLGPVTQLAADELHACALTVLGRVRCWGSNVDDRSTPPADLGQVVWLAVSSRHGCALTALGAVRCWGYDGDGRSMPPDGLGPDGALGPAAQLGVGGDHNCVLTVGGAVHCWGSNANDRSTPPADDLGPFAQLEVGRDHSCVLTVGGKVRCWGLNDDDQATPPEDLDQVGQIGVGDSHSCALTALGAVECWGGGTASSPPDGLGQDGALGPALQLEVGRFHNCALTLSGELHCWGNVVDFSSLPPGAVTTVDASGRCALLADGSLYCPNNPGFFPSELRPGDGVMSVWPRQLQAGQQAAIHFVNLRETTQVFTAQFEVFGDGAADVSSDYRLLDSDGEPLVAEDDGSYTIDGQVGSPATGRGSPMAWLESLVDGPSFLYVRPLELQPTDGPPLSIRDVAQRVTQLSTLDVTGDGRVGKEDIILLMRFVGVGSDSLSQRADAAEVQARLESLLPMDVVDLRLDLDGNGRISTADLRFLLRYLAGLRGAALGEGVEQEQVEAVFQPNP